MDWPLFTAASTFTATMTHHTHTKHTHTHKTHTHTHAHTHVHTHSHVYPRFRFGRAPLSPRFGRPSPASSVEPRSEAATKCEANKVMKHNDICSIECDANNGYTLAGVVTTYICAFKKITTTNVVDAAANLCKKRQCQVRADPPLHCSVRSRGISSSTYRYRCSTIL